MTPESERITNRQFPNVEYIINGVLAKHIPWRYLSSPNSYERQRVHCDEGDGSIPPEFDSWDQWRQHVARIIANALNPDGHPPHPVAYEQRLGTDCEEYDWHGCAVKGCPAACYLTDRGQGDQRSVSTTAPLYRAVDQHAGTPASLADALVLIAHLTDERDRVIKQRDDAIAERDNMVDLGKQVGQLSTYLEHAIADRDDFREASDEWREKYAAAQCRMDEMAAEVAAAERNLDRLAAERDDANDATVAARSDLAAHL